MYLNYRVLRLVIEPLYMCEVCVFIGDSVSYFTFRLNMLTHLVLVVGMVSAGASHLVNSLLTY